MAKDSNAIGGGCPLEKRLQDKLRRYGALALSEPALSDCARDPCSDYAFLCARLVPVRQMRFHMPLHVEARVGQQREAAILQLWGIHLVLGGGEDEDGCAGGGGALVSRKRDRIDET